MTLVWRPGFQFDADASTYIEAVEAADTQALETGVRYAINDFVIGCKNDGIWNAIKASCILAGARTLNGALVPLVGTAPTNYNFVSGDYDRETGLVGDQSTKYLATGLLDNSQPQNNFHLSAYVLDPGGATSGWIGAQSSSFLLRSGGNTFNSRNRSSVNNAIAGVVYSSLPYLAGVSRTESANYMERIRQQSFTVSSLSVAPNNEELQVFKSAGSFASARLAFYSIGESLDLAALDTRVSALITAIGAAIP